MITHNTSIGRFYFDFAAGNRLIGNDFSGGMKFSPDLTFRVAAALQRLGYSIFGLHELERLFGETKDAKGRMRLLEEFAAQCGATVETMPNFKSARLSRRRIRASLRLPAFRERWIVKFEEKRKTRKGSQTSPLTMSVFRRLRSLWPAGC
ncbi:MAG: hypothetical protein WDN28_20525 [Chthoniobacter sp.]